jgi:low temperature requirement protein LtrA
LPARGAPVETRHFAERFQLFIIIALGESIVITGATTAGLELLGHVLFRLRMAGSLSWKRLGGALACVAAGAIGPVVPALVLATVIVAILIGVIGAEQLAARQPRLPPAGETPRRA